MIGIVIVTHRQLGDALIDTAEFILRNKPEATVSVSIDLRESADILRKKIAEGIKKVDQKKGILLLTDMFEQERSAAATVESKRVYCSLCGTRNLLEATYCKRCGKEIKKAVQNT